MNIQKNKKNLEQKLINNLNSINIKSISAKEINSFHNKTVLALSHFRFRGELEMFSSKGFKVCLSQNINVDLCTAIPAEIIIPLSSAARRHAV